MREFLHNLLTGPSGTDQRVANHLALWGTMLGIAVWLTSWVHCEWFGGKALVDMSGYAAFLSSAIITVGAAEAGADFACRKHEGHE